MKHQLRPWLSNLEALEKAATPEPWEYDSVPLERNELGYKTLGPSAIPPRYHLLQTADVHPQLKAKLPIVGIATGPYYDPKNAIFIREQDGKLMAASRNALPRLIAIAKAAEVVAGRVYHGGGCSRTLNCCTCGMAALRDALDKSDANFLPCLIVEARKVDELELQLSLAKEAYEGEREFIEKIETWVGADCHGSLGTGIESAVKRLTDKIRRLEAIERVAQRMDDMRRVSSAPDRMNHLASCAKNTPGGLLLDCTCGMDALRAALGASE